MENELIKNNDEFNSFFNNIKNLVMNSRIKYIRQLIQKFLTYIGIQEKKLWEFNKEMKEQVMVMLYQKNYLKN